MIIFFIFKAAKTFIIYLFSTGLPTFIQIQTEADWCWSNWHQFKADLILFKMFSLAAHIIMLIIGANVMKCEVRCSNRHATMFLWQHITLSLLHHTLRWQTQPIRPSEIYEYCLLAWVLACQCTAPTSTHVASLHIFLPSNQTRAEN